MGVPKRRVSHARQGERRAHLAHRACRQLEECSHCHEMKLPHHVCPNCGYYQGRLAVELKPDRRPTTPRSLTRSTDARPPEPRPRRGADAAVRVAVDAMGGDHGPAEVVPGALDHARAHPEDRVILVGDEAIDPRASPATLPANVSIVHASQVVGMDEHPALALREKKDASILVAIDLVKRGEADAVVTAGHTGAGMAAAVLRLGRLPGVDRPALAVQMITDAGPDRPPRHRRQPRLDPREPRPVRADGRDLRRARPGRRPAARRAAVDRRGEGQGRRPDPAGDRAARRDRPELHRQRRGQGPDPAHGRRRRLRRRRSATS